jgi:hypothetical protein
MLEKVAHESSRMERRVAGEIEEVAPGAVVKS